MRGKNTTIIKSVAGQLIFLIILVAAWQSLYYICVSVLKLWKPYAFPNPIGVWKSFLLMLKQNTLFSAVLYSLRRALIGYFSSIAIGVVLGILLSKSKLLSQTVKPIMLGIQTLPSICWVPFAILWFGLNESAIIFVIIMGSAFSVAISVDLALRSVNPIYVKAAKTMGANEFDLYFKVVIPASLPALISGLKQGWSFAWRSLMSGEVMSASIGLGQALIMGRDLADINRVMLVVIIIIIIGTVVERLFFSILESKVLKRMGLAG